MTLGDLIKKYRNENNLSMAEFATKSGLSKAYISLLEKNKNPKTGKEITPSIDVIKKVSDAIGMNFDEVFSSIDSTTKIVIPKIPLEAFDTRKAEEEFIKNAINIMLENTFPLPKTKKVPLLGTIACGEPILATENIEAYVDMDSDIHADFALRCQGDSMINARIMDGDIVYIRKQDMVENGEIAAVLMDDCEESNTTLKRIYISDDKIRLCVENPNYKDIIFFEDDMNKVRIVGKAIAFLSSIK